jgi:hypothetical protein
LIFPNPTLLAHSIKNSSTKGTKITKGGKKGEFNTIHPTRLESDHARRGIPCICHPPFVIFVPFVDSFFFGGGVRREVSEFPWLTEIYEEFIWIRIAVKEGH